MLTVQQQMFITGLVKAATDEPFVPPSPSPTPTLEAVTPTAVPSQSKNVAALTPETTPRLRYAPATSIQRSPQGELMRSDRLLETPYKPGQSHLLPGVEGFLPNETLADAENRSMTDFQADPRARRLGVNRPENELDFVAGGHKVYDSPHYRDLMLAEAIRTKSLATPPVIPWWRQAVRGATDWYDGSVLGPLHSPLRMNHFKNQPTTPPNTQRRPTGGPLPNQSVMPLMSLGKGASTQNTPPPATATPPLNTTPTPPAGAPVSIATSALPPARPLKGWELVLPALLAAGAGATYGAVKAPGGSPARGALAGGMAGAGAGAGLTGAHQFMTSPYGSLMHDSPNVSAAMLLGSAGLGGAAGLRAGRATADAAGLPGKKRKNDLAEIDLLHGKFKLPHSLSQYFR